MPNRSLLLFAFILGCATVGMATAYANDPPPHAEHVRATELPRPANPVRIAMVTPTPLLEQVPALDQSLSELKDKQITCNGTTVTPILASIPNGATRADAMYIANSSATCVRIGGRTVGAATGASIGAGCRDGPGISIDARLAFCLVSSATEITLDVVYGVR